MSTPTRSRPARSGWVIGHVARIPVVLAPSWLLAAVVLTLLVAPSVEERSRGTGALIYVVALAFVVVLFGSVFLHELAHALVGRSRGQEPKELVLTLWGGHTSFQAAASTPATSALVAVVGPVANLLLAGVALAVAATMDDRTLGGMLVWSFVLTNGFVGLFNLIPGLPMDGGRVLEAIVWARTGDRAKGTVAGGWAGRVVAVGVFAWAFGVPLAVGGRPSLYDVAWGALIGAFLWAGATASIRSGRAQRNVGRVTLASVGRRAVGVGHASSLAAAAAAAAAAGADEIVLLAPDGRPAAYVDTAAARAVPADAAATTPVTAVAIALPVGSVVDGALEGQALVAGLAAATRFSPVVVALVDGRVAGLVRASDVIAAIRS